MFYHRCNLVAKDLLSGEQWLSKKMNNPMIKLKILTLSAEIKQHTKLSAMAGCISRWSSTFEMQIL